MLFILSVVCCFFMVHCRHVAPFPTSAKGRKVVAKEQGIPFPRLLRFIHHEHYLDSEEFSLLRPRFVANGFVECASGQNVITGEEDAVWVLGHLSGTGGGWLYAALSGVLDSNTSHIVNAFPSSGHLGNKDDVSIEGRVRETESKFRFKW